MTSAIASSSHPTQKECTRMSFVVPAHFASFASCVAAVLAAAHKNKVLESSERER